MRKVRYSVAASLDGYIAGPNGEIDWITEDPEIDFQKMYSEFDTLLAGRRTFEEMVRTEHTTLPGMKTVVFSRTLEPKDYPNVTIISGNAEETVRALRTEPGKDIWLFGGGSLFASLAQAGLVDTVEVAVIPVLLGEGIPLAPLPANRRVNLRLTEHRIYKTGISFLQYAVV